MTDAFLRTSLLDLYKTLGDPTGLLLGGGYGLYLKQLHMAQTNQPTLIRADLWPVPRATQDLDLILAAELVANASSMRAIRAALDELGYKVIKGAEFTQFAKTAGANQRAKIDLLTAQLDQLEGFATIQADDRRARPTSPDRPKLHAHPTDGALQLTASPLLLDVTGLLSDGTPHTAQVAVPHSFAYLLMKLTAYRDRRDDPDKDLGRHHALDAFRIVAMLASTEYEKIRTQLGLFGGNPQVCSCREVVRSDFDRGTARGMLAMRQHPLWQNDGEMDLFLELLRDLFL